MNKHTAQAFVAAGLVAAGLVGLYLKVEYSGWVLAIGLLAAAQL